MSTRRLLTRKSIIIACAGVALTGLAFMTKPSPAEPARTKRFTLVYNVNNGGYVDVCGCKHKEVRQGSLTRRASFLKQLRATDRDLLLLDGGSTLFPIKERVKEPQLKEAIRKAELIVEAYNRMGYKAMAVGAFDLAAGIDTLEQLEKKASFKILSANLADKMTGTLYFEPHTVIEVAGVRVGVIGLTLETLSKVYLEKVAPDAKLLNPYEAARSSFVKLRDKTDLIVTLSHLREESNFELVKKLSGLEILVDPFIQYKNHRTWIKEDEWLQLRDDTVFLRSDGQGARLGLVDIELRKPRSKLVSSDELLELEDLVAQGQADSNRLVKLRDENLFTFTRVSIEPHHLTDPEIDYLVEQWKKNIDPSAVRRYEEKLPRRKEFLSHTACKDCHKKQYDNWLKTKHAHALDSLKKTNDHHRFDCIGCHTLGYGEAFVDTSRVGKYAHVQCESCHGTNPKHVDAPRENRFGAVLRVTCLACHNPEVTLKPFPFFPAKRKVQCPKG